MNTVAVLLAIMWLYTAVATTYGLALWWDATRDARERACGHVARVIGGMRHPRHGTAPPPPTGAGTGVPAAAFARRLAVVNTCGATAADAERAMVRLARGLTPTRD